MKLLILGYSNIVRRRVLAAAEACPWIEGVEVASRGFADAVPEPLAGVRTLADYGEALERSPCELVYVSLVNSAHDEWVLRALESGRHVIVDKPAFSSLAVAERAVELARRHDRVLAEATVWAHHPQVAVLLDAISAAPRRVSAVFTYPPLPRTNFRWQAELGGGALSDLGPYAVSVGRVLFAAEPRALGARVLARARGVDTGFCLWADYGEGRGLSGHFAADAAYCNRVEILGESTRARVDRIFTTPPTLENRIELVEGREVRELRCPAADSFAEFLSAVGRAVVAGDGGALADELLADARALARLRRACERGGT